MNTITNNIRISDLPCYVKSFSSRHVLPELDCHWSEVHCSFPFILAMTGNIATAETFPYNRKEYRLTGDGFSFPRRANFRGGWHQLSFTFDIVEKVATGEQFAILHNVERGGLVW